MTDPSSPAAPSRVRIPADVDRPDRLLAGLTARQLAILAVAALTLYSGYAATRPLVPLPVFAALAVPVGLVAVTLAVGRVAGQPADRVALAALAHLRAPRRLVPAADGIPALPGWMAGPPGPVPAPLRLPLTGISADGMVDLGGDGAAVVCRASTVTFALRTPAEQEALVAGFARWLNSLAEPVQILLRAAPVELTPMIDRLRADATGLPHPALEAAARAHAAFLAELSAGRTLLRREVLVVLRQPAGPGTAERLTRRVEEATAGLAAAGVALTRLDGPAVVGYPREVGLGWLEPLTAHPGRLDVALHLDPLPAATAADRLRRQLARLESDRRAGAARGRLADPDLDVAAADARELAAGLARGEQRLFRVGLAVTVHAETQAALREEVTRVRAVCASLLLDAQPLTWRQLAGWVATLPLAVDPVNLRRSMDTAAAAAAYPFASAELPAAPGGVLLGAAPSGGGLVCWDRFGCDNHNAVILARSGAGKSYLAKLETLRWLTAGVQVAVVDPEDEYAALAAAVGGAHLRLGAPGVRLNPFDLPAGRDDALTRRALFIHTLIAVLLGAPLDPAAVAALDRAVLAAYATVGITPDPRTHARPAPLLADLAAALAADPDPESTQLPGRLAPYVTGSHKGLFDGPTTTRPDGHLVAFSLRELPDELKAAGTLLTLDAIWSRVADPTDRRRRLVVVDEAWLLMREPAGARFLFRMAKAARKHHAGLTVITQDSADLLGTDLGQAVVANAATQILLRQAPQAIDTVTAAFGLSDGERGYLLGARRGDALLAHGADRVAFTALASTSEDRLCRAGSDPTLPVDDDVL